jgi:VIT1/CCC1 family predicted Fe2+/Mn2+ transporter
MSTMLLKRFAFGTTAALMTSMALIIGLGSANTGKVSIIAGLLIIGIADNISDSLGIHLHEEADLGVSQALSIAVSNYVTRLVAVCSFVALVAFLPLDVARWVSLAWGTVLLSVLTYFIAKARSARPMTEILKHLVVAAAVIGISHLIGLAINRMV